MVKIGLLGCGSLYELQPSLTERSEDTGHMDSHETQTTESAHLHAHARALEEASRQGALRGACGRALVRESKWRDTRQGYRCMQMGAFTDGHTHAQHTHSCTQISAQRCLGQGMS